MKLCNGIGAFGMLFTLAVLPLSSSAVAFPPPVEQPAVHPHRIIVKYRSTVSACAHCLLARGIPFASVTGTNSLDHLNRRFQVRGAEGLFSKDHASGARAARYRSQLEGVQARFPVRAARRPAGSIAPDLSNVFVLELGSNAVAEAVKAFASDPDVELAEPDYRVQASFTPNDPYFASSGAWGLPFADLWGLHTTQADAAWDVANGTGMVVAVLDTGVNFKHPDLINNAWTNPGEIPRNHIDDDGNGYVDDVYGWDFVKNTNNVKDGHGHGTHVAGTIAATGNNGMGVVGMAWGARVMAVRGLDAHGSGYSSDLAKGIVYAANNGADVLNNSWGGSESWAVNDAIATATNLGAVVVFAAGNSSSPYLGQAANPNVIAVAATSFDDQPAGFSNYGPQISIAAPGTEILSLSGASRTGGRRVGRKYRVLSGTSMAAPHAAGAAALLLSDQPGLSTDEVRWHLELNADQLGHSGYEGQPWNPYLGWGRLNASRVFAAPPITTRIRTAPFELHGLVDSLVSDVASLDFLFTTKQAVDWTLSGPSWLIPGVTSGSGPATVPLSFDTAKLPPGTYPGSATVTAPAAADGGASLAATAYVHRENRTGSEVVVNYPHYPRGGAPQVASDGQGAMTVWVQWDYKEDGSGEIHLKGSYVDDSGSVTGPFLIDRGTYSFFGTMKDGGDVAVAAGDQNFLVMWTETLEEFVSETSLRTRRHTYVKATRITRAGAILDVPPIEVSHEVESDNSIGGFDRFNGAHAVAFDGSAYTLIWRTLDFGSSSKPVEVFLRRIGADGTLLSPLRSIYPAPWTGARYQAIDPKLACVTGSCLLAWAEADGETTADGKYVDKMYGQRFAGDQPVDAVPSRLLTDIESVDAITSSGSGYFAAGWRFILNPGPPRTGGYDLVGARITAGAVSLDPAGIRLNNSPPSGSPRFLEPRSASFDGTSYNVLWTEVGPATSAGLCYPFVARVSPAGQVLDSDEAEGLLLAPRANTDSSQSTLVTTATKSLLVWAERWNYPDPTRIVAQGVLSRSAGE